MDRYQTVAARFSRRRLLAIAVTFPAAFAFVFLGGNFTQAEAVDSALVALAGVLLIPLIQTFALKTGARARSPSDRVRERRRDAHRDAICAPCRRGSSSPGRSRFCSSRRSAASEETCSPVVPPERNLAVALIGAGLCWLMYASLLGLAFEEALAGFDVLASEALGATMPVARMTTGGIAGRIALVIVTTVTFVTAVTGIITIRGSGGPMAFLLTGAIIVVYAVLRSALSRRVDRASPGVDRTRARPRRRR